MKALNLRKYLDDAGVPKSLHSEALQSIELARERSKGLLWHKIKVRFFKSAKISKMLEWEDNRLIDVRPDLIDWDIAPMINITANGDNGPWVNTNQGGRPVKDYWLNTDPESDEYKYAVSKNYWCKGNHPRSIKSRKAWYLRNGGEGRAWRLGEVVLPDEYKEPWVSKGIKVHQNNKSWLITGKIKLFGFIPCNLRVGFEIDNVFSGDYSPQMWFPVDGYELKAPVTWSIIPSFK